ncbi:hypothetical protein FXO37_02827 [Capsicum annuum]|nr:hypothetical protein FXO37_02827 [Capsicum annuum]
MTTGNKSAGVSPTMVQLKNGEVSKSLTGASTSSSGPRVGEENDQIRAVKGINQHKSKAVITKENVQDWMSIVKSPKSWADEVEEMETQSKNGAGMSPLTDNHSTVRNSFDVRKFANASFKLDYVKPSTEGELLMIAIEDNNLEVEYWRNVVVWYVLGAHPPFTVLNGFMQRNWDRLGISKVTVLKNGIILVRFNISEGKDEVLQGGIYHFDKTSNC